MIIDIDDIKGANIDSDNDVCFELTRYSGEKETAYITEEAIAKLIKVLREDE